MNIVELAEIIKELSVFGHDRPVPKEALAEAARQKDSVTPVLLDALKTVYERVQTEGEDICDDPAYDLSYYAIFLLAQFREQRAFPLLLQVLELDKDSLDIMLGDAFPDFMPKALYSTYNGDLSALKSVMINNRLEPFARGAALEVLGGLLRDGLLSREELIGFLRERLSVLGDSEDERIFGAMVAGLIADSDLYELTEDVREAYRKEKIDLMNLGDFSDFFDYLHNETMEYRDVQLLEDTAQELEGWACFQSSKPSRMDILQWKAGRNDPCPCGSGKKFKKCCLPKQEELKQKLSSIEMGIDDIDRDKYPPVERQGSRPGLSDFYSRDAIEVDRMAYQALLRLRHPAYRQRKETRRAVQEARELLWSAFEKFRLICEENGLKTPEEFDLKHKLHYLSREWLEELEEQLEEVRDKRCQAVQAVLQGPSE